MMGDIRYQSPSLLESYGFVGRGYEKGHQQESIDGRVSQNNACFVKDTYRSAGWRAWVTSVRSQVRVKASPSIWNNISLGLTV